MFERIKELLPILRCPRTHTALDVDNGKLISDGGEEYPIAGEKRTLRASDDRDPQASRNFLYKRLCRENGIELNTARPNDPKPISEILAQCKPDDILSQESVIAANDALSRAEQDLRTSRDEWIKLYTGATSCALP